MRIIDAHTHLGEDLRFGTDDSADVLLMIARHIESAASNRKENIREEDRTGRVGCRRSDEYVD